MNELKSRLVDNITAWDLHTLVHYPDSAPGKISDFWLLLGTSSS